MTETEHNPPSPSPVVSCVDVSRVYQQGDLQVNALTDINFTANRGDFICLSGPSGSGKSTLLNMIGGLDTPSKGEVYIDGQEIDELDKSDLADLRLHKIGFIFQAYNLIPVLTVQENVEMVMQMQGQPATQRHKQSSAILKEVGLNGMEHRKPPELSGGQQQRVAVARAIVSKPSLVLADEPTANLDSVTASKLIDLMLDMNAQHSITFIISTHDPMIMQRSRTLVKLHDGKIIDVISQ